MVDHEQLGAELVAARRNKVPWKDLVARYGYGRTRLWMIWSEALRKNVHEHLSGGQDSANTQSLVAN